MELAQDHRAWYDASAPIQIVLLTAICRHRATYTISDSCSHVCKASSTFLKVQLGLLAAHTGEVGGDG
jgi:hypothetical protein